MITLEGCKSCGWWGIGPNPPTKPTSAPCAGGGAECDNIYTGEGKVLCWRCGKETELVEANKQPHERPPRPDHHRASHLLHPVCAAHAGYLVMRNNIDWWHVMGCAIIAAGALLLMAVLL